MLYAIELSASRVVMVVGNKILIVDDEPSIARSLSFVLNKGGYDVTVAEVGEQAMALVRESTPDIMILDVMMPKING